MLPMLNRSALLLTPREPFRSWLRSHAQREPHGVDEDELARAGLDDRTVYLLPDYDSDDEAQALVATFATIVFEAALNEWYIDESMWPPQRDAATFRKWFDIEVMGVVVDAAEHPLELD